MSAQWGKILGVLQDPKFWALASAITGIVVGLQTGQLTGPQAETGAVGALAAYMIASGIKAHGEAMAVAPPPVVNVAVHPAVGATGLAATQFNASVTGTPAVTVSTIPTSGALTKCAGGR